MNHLAPLAAFLGEPAEGILAESKNFIYTAILDKLDSLGFQTKVRSEPKKPLTRFYILEDNGNVKALGFGETRCEAATKAVVQFMDREIT